MNQKKSVKFRTQFYRRGHSLPMDRSKGISTKKDQQAAGQTYSQIYIQIEVPQDKMN